MQYYRQSKRISYWWIPIILVLIACLVVQLGMNFRKELSAYPEIEPWLDLACEKLPCKSKTSKDEYRSLRIVSREVIAHPSTDKAVQVNAAIINEAMSAIDFPILELNFKNIENIVIAKRRFTPKEYLADNLDITSGITPQELHRISLDLVDPGEAAVAFEFHFIPNN